MNTSGAMTLYAAGVPVTQNLGEGAFLYRRRAMYARNLDRRRSIFDECGFPQTEEMTPERWYHLHDRNEIAARVNEMMVKEAFQVQPTVYEDNDPEAETEFETAWDAIGSGLGGEPSSYAEEKDSKVWAYVKRWLTQARMGRYAVLLLGFDDLKPGEFLSKPAEPVPYKANGGRRLQFLRVFPERLAPVSQWESNPASPRFGQPLMYSVTFHDPLASGMFSPYSGPTSRTAEVHWTRVVHYAPNLTTSEWLGTPECQSVLNRLMSLEKIYGADGEGYWKSAFPYVGFESTPQMGPDVEYDEQSMKDMMEDMQNGLQRSYVVVGFNGKLLSPSMVDPKSHIDAQMEAIAINKGVPVRILKGSERGELASTQDDMAWNDRVAEFQSTEITPRAVVPLVDRLINMGCLPKPAAGYKVEWPAVESQSEQEKSAIATARTQAIAQYVTAGADSLIPPADFLTRVLGFSDEDATAILDGAAKHLEESSSPEDKGDSPLFGDPAGISAVIALFTAAKAGAVSEDQVREILVTFFKIPDATADAIIADGLTQAAQDAGEPPLPPPPVVVPPGHPAAGGPPNGPPAPGQPKPNPFAKSGAPNGKPAPAAGGVK